MKKIILVILVVFVLSTSVSAFSFKDFFSDVGELITGWQVAEPGSVPDDGGPTCATCAAPVPGGSGGGGDSVAQPVVLKRCSDGTLVGECNSGNSYCSSDQELIVDCNRCGADPGSECDEETAQEIMYVDCASANGVCDVQCTRGFEHVSRLDSSCVDLTQDVVAVDITGLVVGMAVENWYDVGGNEGLVCCVPTEDVTEFINISLTNLTNETVNRVIQDTKFESLSCVEGTESGSCLDEKPFYCQNSVITSFCSYCGCSDGEVCNLRTNVCVRGMAVESVEIVKEFLGLSVSESNLVEDILIDVASVEKVSIVPVVDYDIEEKEISVTLDEESSLLLSFDERGLPKISLDIES